MRDSPRRPLVKKNKKWEIFERSALPVVAIKNSKKPSHSQMCYGK